MLQTHLLSFLHRCRRDRIILANYFEKWYSFGIKHSWTLFCFTDLFHAIPLTGFTPVCTVSSHCWRFWLNFLVALQYTPLLRALSLILQRTITINADEKHSIIFKWHGEYTMIVPKHFISLIILTHINNLCFSDEFPINKKNWLKLCFKKELNCLNIYNPAFWFNFNT